MKELNEDLKSGQLAPVYLLYGEEAYLKRQYKERLAKAILPELEGMNYAYYEGKGISVGEVIDQAETLPFFAEHRLIIIENSGFFKSAEPALADYIKAMDTATHFIFVETELDKRNRLYKAVQQKGRAVELARQTEATLRRWIAGMVKKENKEIAEETISYFLARVGMDMEHIQNELEKLFTYTIDREAITKADVDAICTVQINNRIFDMVDAVAYRQQAKALDYYYDLLALKEPPMRILYLLSRQFKIILQVKEMVARGYPNKKIAEDIRIPSFAIGKYQNQAKAFQKNELKEILEISANTEEQVKTGRLNDVIGVELFIVQHTREIRAKRC